MSGRLFPRLARELARVRIAELRGRSPEELLSGVELLIDGHTYAPIGGNKVLEEDLSALLLAAGRLARECGFPDQRREESRLRFDRKIAQLLHEEMEITPHQAADEEIWAHLTVGPLVALAAWRFPGLPDQRVLGRAPRNTFRRLWWRAEVLGASACAEEGGLLEDETVQIMERTGIAASPSVARSLADAFGRRLAASPGLRRMELMRDAMKRVNRLTPFIALEALPSAALAARLDQVFEASAIALGVEEPASADLVDEAFGGSAEYRAAPEAMFGRVPTSFLPPPVDGEEPNGGYSGGEVFDQVAIGLLVEKLVEAVRSKGTVRDGDLDAIFSQRTGIEVSARRQRLLRKLAWSLKGRRQLDLDEDGEIWSAGELNPSFDDRIGQWSIASLINRAGVLLAEEDDPFDRLLAEICGEERASRVVASIVGTAINEASRSGGNNG